MYRFLALLPGHDPDERARIGAALRDTGLPRVVSLDGLDIHACDRTPVVQLSPTTALVGHAFGHDDQPARIPNARADATVRHALDTCWGEYLLLCRHDDDPSALTVLRDPSGGVDCTYSLQDGFLTSDITIAEHLGLFRRSIDWDFIGGSLQYPHLKCGRTGLSGLRELLPGCRLDIRDGAASTQPVWDPWRFVASPHRHHKRADAQAEVRHAVSRAVRRWARTDASVLVELSGGLDSSVVAACLGDVEARVACCNLITPVPGADERRYAVPMADLLGVGLEVRSLGFDQPLFDAPPPRHAVAPSTWFLQHAANALKASVGEALDVDSFYSGGGGDTVFCYTKTAAPAADAFRERGVVAGLRAVHDLAELHQCTVWKAGRLALRKLRAPPKPPRRPDRSFLPAELPPEPLPAHPWFKAPEGALPGDRERVFDLAGTQVFRDGIGRSARRHLRMPLLSQPVVEACLKVPSWMWIDGGRNRAVARDAFADRLPPTVLHRRSKGTFMNYSGAMFRRNRDRLRDYLLGGALRARGLVDADALQHFFDAPASPDGDGFMRIFDLCAVESWVRHQG